MVRLTLSWAQRLNNPQQYNKNLCINIKSGTHHRAALFSPLSSFCFAFASGLALVLVFLCPFPRMLFGYPCIVFIVIPSFPCSSVQFRAIQWSPHSPKRPMCCFGRNSCWLKLFKLLIKIYIPCPFVLFPPHLLKI